MLSVNPVSHVIYIPKAYLAGAGGTIYSLDTNRLRVDLRAWEASEEGRTENRTHDHNPEYTVAGVTYARKFEIINGYRVQFEDGQYSVILSGSNNNIFDAPSVLMQNQVQIISNNSAGLQTVELGIGGDISGKIDDIWKILGLDSSAPLSVTQSSREAGEISQTITGDGVNISVVQRQ